MCVCVWQGVRGVVCCLFLVVFVFLFDTQLKRERVKFENFRSPRNNWKVKGLEQSEKGEELLGNK